MIKTGKDQNVGNGLRRSGNNLFHLAVLGQRRYARNTYQTYDVDTEKLITHVKDKVINLFL